MPRASIQRRAAARSRPASRQRPAPVAALKRQHEVGAHRKVAHDPVGLALGGDEADPRPLAPARRARLVSVAAQPELAGVGPPRGAVEHAAQEFHARAHEPEHAQDLARAHLERHVAQAVAPGEPAHAQDGRARLDRLPGVEERAARAAQHRLHHRVGLGGPGVELAGHPAVAQHHDAIGDDEHLAEVVRDVDDGRPSLAQPAHDGEDRLGLALAERGGGLVHHEDPRVGRERPGDLDDPLLRHGQRAHRRVGVDGAEPQLLPGSLRPAPASPRGRARPVPAGSDRASPASATFSATLISGITEISWGRKLTPRRLASRGPEAASGSPSTSISPPSRA